MRIVRDYFGLDRTTVTYDSEITGVGGNADAFYVVAEVTKGDGSLATRTVVTFSHGEVARMLAEYRCNYPIDNPALRPPLSLDHPRDPASDSPSLSAHLPAFEECPSVGAGIARRLAKLAVCVVLARARVMRSKPFRHFDDPAKVL